MKVELHVLRSGAFQSRRGNIRQWPFGERKIYDMNRIIDSDQQTIYEYGLLVTTPDQINEDGNMVSEVYFVLVIFGVEFAINFGGPDLTTYHKLIETHKGAPLLDLCEIIHKNSPFYVLDETSNSTQR